MGPIGCCKSKNYIHHREVMSPIICEPAEIQKKNVIQILLMVQIAVTLRSYP